MDLRIDDLARMLSFGKDCMCVEFLVCIMFSANSCCVDCLFLIRIDKGTRNHWSV